MNNLIKTSSSYSNGKRPWVGRYAFVASSFILLVLAGVPNAANSGTDWIGTPKEHDWFNAVNWGNGVPPQPANGKTTIANGGTPRIEGGAANAGFDLFIDKFSTLTLSAGSLTADNERLGLSNNGNFTQSNGTNQATVLSIGYVVPGDSFTASGTGTYDLSGGALNVTGSSRIGEGGAGTFNQTGGNHTSELLLLGGRIEFSDHTVSNPGVGTYILSGGSLTVKDETEVGLSGKGTFTQEVGTHTTGSLYVGWAANLPSGRFSGFGDGTYNLYSGALIVSGETHVGYVGSGTFNQTGGTQTISDTLTIGQSGGQGTYNLSGNGSALTASNERIGAGGVGTFTQTNGTNKVNDMLSIGYVVPGDSFTASGTGTYDLSGGALNVTGSSRIGEGGAGTFNQTGGNHTSELLLLGGRVEFPDGTVSNPGVGTYILNGGSLTVKDKTEVGLSGKGTFTQEGGTHTSGSLYVGWAANLPSGRFSGFGDGTYNLYSGALNVSGISQVGTGGSGTFNHNGGAFTTETLNLGIKTDQAGGSNEGIYNLSGTGSLTALNENVGFSGTGKFNQSGGTHIVSDTLTIGQSGGQGTYTLSGGSLNTTNEIAGYGNASTGAFIQTDGTHTVSDTLTIGQFGGQGTYTLSGGGSALTASKEYIGLGGLGSFTQTSGTHTVNNTLSIGSSIGGSSGNGTYVLNGGSLIAANEITGDGNGATGAFTQSGGTHTVSDKLTIGQSGGQGIYNLSGEGSILNALNEYIGFGGTGSFTQTDGTHTVNYNLFVGSSAASLGSSNGTYTLKGGRLNTAEEIVGDGNGNTGSFNQSGGTHNFSEVLIIGQSGGQGTYNLNGGGSVLTASYEYIGNRGLGSFTQTDGTHTVNNKLSIGTSAEGLGGNGAYALDGGGLNVTDEIVGDGNGNIGTFNQSGGIHTVTGKLTIGQFLSQGTYNLSGGGSVLTSSSEYIGLGGLGSFTQIGGTHTVNNSLFLGSSASGGEDGELGGNGTYTLNGGSLNATDEIAGNGNGSIGAFTQTGGTHTVGNTLTIGQSGGQGTYNLSGNGSVLTTSNEYIGIAGLGSFTQTSGTHTINNTLSIGSSAGGAGGNGTYALNGGSLNAANEIIGDGNGNTGAFNQTGGTHSVSKMLTIGNNGSYLLSGGTLSAPDLINNNSFDQSGGAYSGIFHNNKQFIYSGGSFDGSLINEGTAIFNPSLQQASFGANISGTGGLTKQGNDTLILTGDNSYNGGTTVSAGVLQGNTDSLKGNITNSASVVFDQAKTGTYAGAMSGTGSLTKQNGGTLILTGDNNYSGGTTVSGGVLQGNTDSLKGNIINNAIVVFDQTNTSTYAGTMSGTGSLTKQSGGTLFLTGNNHYNGGTNLNGGTLSVGSDNNLGDQAGALNFNGGILQVTGTGFTSTARRINWGTAGGGFNISNVFTVNQSLGGQGGLTKQGNGALILTGANNYSGGTTVSGGVLQGNIDSLKGDILNNATVVFDQANTGTYTGTMSGTGNLIKQNSGLLIFNSANNTYAGGTEIIQGNLQVGDASHPDASISGPVMIDPTGILSGHGTINGNVNNAGILSPGGSIGTLYVNGNVNFTSNSIFNVEINPLEASLLNVSGQASLGNAHVSVLADNGTYSPHTYRILNANSVSGVFNSVNIVNAADIPSLKMLTPSLQFFPDHVNLSLDVASDPTGPGTSITDKWFKTTLRTVGGRLNAPLGKSCPQNSLGFWARGVGMISSADASGDAPRYDGGTAGVVMGVDRQFSESLSLGIAGFTAHTDATTYQSSNNQSTVNSGGVSLYGAYTLGAWQFKSVFGYDNDTYKAQRNIAVSSLSRQAQSKTYGNRVNNYTEASYSFKSGNLTLQPVAGLQLGWMRRDGFNETGPNSDGQNINVNGRTLYALDTLVGLRTRHELPINNNLKAQLELRTLYDHDFGTLQNSVAATLSNGQTRLLSTADRPTQRDAGIVGASVALLTTDSLNFYLDYNGEFRSGQQAHFISAGVRYSW